MNRTSTELFGAGRFLEGLSPYAGPYADRDFDVDAAIADADARGCAYGDFADGGEMATAKTWRWSRTDAGLRIHPPFLHDEAYAFGGHRDWPGYRDYLGPSWDDSGL